jgi:hypothetical protein
MTENSNEAFHATKEQRAKNELLVFNALLKNPRSSRFCIGRITGLGDIEAQRRISDLVSNDKVVIVGKRKHFKRNISLYSVKDQMELYPTEKKLTYIQYCKTREDWKHIYEALINHKIN